MKKEKTTIIRPQSRGDSRFVRVLTMLVLLITAATGAWAQASTTYTVKMKDGTQDAKNWTITSGQKSTTGDNADGLTGLSKKDAVTLTYGGRLKVKSVTATADAAPAAAPTLAETLTNAGMTVKVKYNYYNEDCYCLFVSNGDDTYTFQSGGGYGPNNWAKELVVEDGKLVFKQNSWGDIDYSWDVWGYSVTFNTGSNTYRQWAGGDAIDNYNPSFISVEVNGKSISVTQKITVDDLVKEDNQEWSEIVSNNSDMIYEDDGNIKRTSDSALLMKLYKWGGYWEPVNTYDVYEPSSYNYKFEGDDEVVDETGD